MREGVMALAFSMSFYVAIGCQIPKFEPMYVPLTNLFEPNQKFQEAILSINISALTWFGSWASICAAGGGIHMGVFWHRG